MPPTGRPTGLQTPCPATAGPLNGASAAGVGNGDPGTLAGRLLETAGLAVLGVTVFEGLTAVAGDVAGVVASAGATAAGLPVLHDASATLTPISSSTRTRGLTPGSGWTVLTPPR
jgi:hypothetical protein